MIQIVHEHPAIQSVRYRVTTCFVWLYQYTSQDYRARSPVDDYHPPEVTSMTAVVLHYRGRKLKVRGRFGEGCWFKRKLLAVNSSFFVVIIGH